MHWFIEEGMIGGITTLLKDIVKQIINTWQIMMLINQAYLLCI